MMTQRENLLALLRRQPYEFQPVEFVFCPHLQDVLREKTGDPNADYREYFGFPWRDIPLVPDDPTTDRFLPYHAHRMNDRVTIDEWGVGHESTPSSMHMTKMLCPLDSAEDVEEIENYPLPVYTEKGNPDLVEKVKAVQARGLAAVGNMQMTIWEQSWYIRGMENLMMDMMSDDPMATVLLDRITEMSLSRALLYARAGVDILYLGDDIGMQHTIMMSTELYRTWIKPRLTRLIQAVKAERPDILVFYHSCGFIEPFIDDLIDAGVDVLNPIQSECMDFAEIYEKYHDRLSFHGTIGTQTVMPFGTPEEVRQAVWHNLEVAKDGGLFVTPTHMLEPEVPWENVLAYVQACRDYQVKNR